MGGSDCVGDFMLFSGITIMLNAMNYIAFN